MGNEKRREGTEKMLEKKGKKGEEEEEEKEEEAGEDTGTADLSSTPFQFRPFNAYVTHSVRHSLRHCCWNSVSFCVAENGFSNNVSFH